MLTVKFKLYNCKQNSSAMTLQQTITNVMDFVYMRYIIHSDKRVWIQSTLHVSEINYVLRYSLECIKVKVYMRVGD
jgi:hypothetical protein